MCSLFLKYRKIVVLSMGLCYLTGVILYQGQSNLSLLKEAIHFLSHSGDIIDGHYHHHSFAGHSNTHTHQKIDAFETIVIDHSKSHQSQDEIITSSSVKIIPLLNQAKNVNTVDFDNAQTYYDPYLFFEQIHLKIPSPPPQIDLT